MNTDNNFNFANEEKNNANAREVIFKYLHYWKWFVLSLVCFLALAFVYIKLTTPLYQIETDLLIKQDKDDPSFGGGDDILKDLDLFSSDKIIDNEVEILKSYTLFAKVVQDLGLEQFYYDNNGIKKTPLYEKLPFRALLLKPNDNSYSSYLTVKVINSDQLDVDGVKATLNHPVQTDMGLIVVTADEIKPKWIGEEIDVVFNSLPKFYQKYSALLSITPISKEGTVLIITYQDAIPKRGEDMLNKLVDEYNIAAVADKNKETGNTLSFIDDRLRKLAIELGLAENKVEDFKQENNITDINAQSASFIASVQQNDALLSKTTIQLSVLKSLEDYIHTSSQPSQLPSMLGVDDPTLLALVTQLGEAEMKKQSMLQTIPETNPILRTVNDEITSLKASIDQSVKNLQSGLVTTKKQLDAKKAEYDATSKTVPTKERGLLDVMRQQDLRNTLFTFLLQKREEQEMSLASTIADSRTVDYARSTPLPVKPILPLVFFVFTMLGLMVPFSFIYARGVLNNKIIKRSDIDKVTNVPILAEIAHSSVLSALIAVEKPRSMVAEQIRALRTNLQFVSAGSDHKVLLFTSGISGEGKSFISLNLGASLALSGKKVVILELDLRKPKLHVALDIDNDMGLSNYLISNMSYKEVVKEIPQLPGYSIITCGPVPPNPAELLMNGRIGTLVKELQQDYDYILMDAPPIGLVTDAQILGKFANATIFIVRHNYTLKSQVNLIDDLYQNEKFPNLNIVFNSIDYTAYGYGYGDGYGYGYGYGYGNGYYQEDEPKRRSIFKRIFKK